MPEQEQVPPAPTPQQPASAEWRPEGPSGPRASFGQRFLAGLLDVLVVLVVAAVAYLINETLGTIVYLVVALGYGTYFEGSPRGQTPGKMALGIRVVDQNSGGSIGYGRAFIRWLSTILSSIPCYLGYLWMLWDKEKQMWHDKLSSSVVVPVQYYPVS